MSRSMFLCAGAQHEYGDAANGGAGPRQGSGAGQGTLQPALPLARGQAQHHHLRPAEVQFAAVGRVRCTVFKPRAGKAQPLVQRIAGGGVIIVAVVFAIVVVYDVCVLLLVSMSLLLLLLLRLFSLC